MNGPITVFFDGPCVLCNYWIKKLCVWDKNDRFRFTSIESTNAQNFLKKRGYNIQDIDSIITWDSEKDFNVESEAVFRIIYFLGGFWRLLFVFNILPSALKKYLYRYIAKNRYNLFGKYDECPVPEKRFSHKFL